MDNLSRFRRKWWRWHYCAGTSNNRYVVADCCAEKKDDFEINLLEHLLFFFFFFSGKRRSGRGNVAFLLWCTPRTRTVRVYCMKTPCVCVCVCVWIHNASSRKWSDIIHTHTLPCCNKRITKKKNPHKNLPQPTIIICNNFFFAKPSNPGLTLTELLTSCLWGSLRYRLLTKEEEEEEEVADAAALADCSQQTDQSPPLPQDPVTTPRVSRQDSTGSQVPPSDLGWKIKRRNVLYLLYNPAELLNSHA